MKFFFILSLKRNRSAEKKCIFSIKNSNFNVFSYNFVLSMTIFIVFETDIATQFLYPTPR